ncbi:MAG TPA: cation transporting ATPase C-terminal domain-containing protein, partial [Sphingomonas sp.]
AGGDDLARPHCWDMKALVRFTAIMGPLSSLFDVATFVLLLRVFHAGVAEFRAAWFIESMATQILVVFVIRTIRPVWASRPHPVMAATALAGLAVALTLPMLPVAGLLGFAMPPAGALGAIALLVAGYLASAELLKRYALRAG